jgi:hypothetical protein
VCHADQISSKHSTVTQAVQAALHSYTVTPPVHAKLLKLLDTMAGARAAALLLCLSVLALAMATPYGACCHNCNLQCKSQQVCAGLRVHTLDTATYVVNTLGHPFQRAFATIVHPACLAVAA